MLPSKEKILEIIKELQKILHIQDWRIEFDYKATEDGEEIEAAYTNINLDRNYANITIYNDSPEVNEWYNSLIHELLHIVAAPIELAQKTTSNLISGKTQEALNELWIIAKEQTVDKIASAFCSLYPASKFGDSP